MPWYNYNSTKSEGARRFFVKYIIDESQSGKTVKDILRYELGLSAAFIKHLKFIENGITLNGEHATVRRTVKSGDVLLLATEDTENGEQLTPTDIKLDIIFEDDCVIVPSKPPFMPTHPSHLHHGDTLADALAFIYKTRNEPFVFRPINRLDKNTSGLTVIAKSRISAAKLTEAMRNGRIKKQYLAVLNGVLEQDEGTIETHITRTDQSIIVRRVCSADDGGDLALTRYRVLMRANGHTLALAAPITGRTHQLRVHFAHLGCAIVGDDMYGKEDERISRHALHAIKLKFEHPQSKQELTLCAPIPDDMRCLILSIFGECDTLVYSSEFGLN